MGPIICRTYVRYGFSTVKSGEEKLEINNIRGKKGEKKKKNKNPMAKEKREKNYCMVITQGDCPEK